MATNIWRRQGSSRLSSGNLFKKTKSDNMQNIADDFFEYVASGTTGQIKFFNGSQWLAKPVKFWTGSQWVVKPLKRWNGSQWIITPY